MDKKKPDIKKVEKYFDHTRQAILATANNYWVDLAPGGAPQLAAKQEELAGAAISALLAGAEAKVAGNHAIARIKNMEYRSNTNVSDVYALAKTLLSDSAQAFTDMLHPEVRQEEDCAIEKMIKEAEESEGLKPSAPAKERTAAEIGHEQLDQLHYTITKILNPPDNEISNDIHGKISGATGIKKKVADAIQSIDAVAYEVLSKDMAAQIAQEFAAHAAIAKGKLTTITDPEERAVEEKKAYMAAVETLLTRLPESFVHYFVNPQLENNAREAGYSVRGTPENTVESAQRQGQVAGRDGRTV